MDKYERFREEWLNTMEEHLSKSQMFMLGNVICKVLVNYNVQRKSNEVKFYNNANDWLKERLWKK